MSLSRVPAAAPAPHRPGGRGPQPGEDFNDRWGRSTVGSSNVPGASEWLAQQKRDSPDEPMGYLCRRGVSGDNAGKPHRLQSAFSPYAKRVPFDGDV